MKKVLREIITVSFLAASTFIVISPQTSAAAEDCVTGGYCFEICSLDMNIFCIYMDCGSGTQVCETHNHNL